MFQGGVVPSADDFFEDICFRPLMFQGGVVRKEITMKYTISFRPLMFQGGVVLFPMKISARSRF